MGIFYQNTISENMAVKVTVSIEYNLTKRKSSGSIIFSDEHFIVG